MKKNRFELLVIAVAVVVTVVIAIPVLNNHRAEGFRNAAELAAEATRALGGN